MRAQHDQYKPPGSYQPLATERSHYLSPPTLYTMQSLPWTPAKRGWFYCRLTSPNHVPLQTVRLIWPLERSSITKPLSMTPREALTLLCLTRTRSVLKIPQSDCSYPCSTCLGLELRILSQARQSLSYPILSLVVPLVVNSKLAICQDFHDTRLGISSQRSDLTVKGLAEIKYQLRKLIV